VVLSPTGSINLGFTTEGRLVGVSNWAVTHIKLLHQHRTTNKFSGAVAEEQRRRRSSHVNYAPANHQQFSGAVAGEKEDFCKGSLSLPIFYFVIVLLYFIFVCIILSKIQKKSSL
jgi:hypothetical protein